MLRRKEFAMNREEALQFLQRSPMIRFGTSLPEGVPILRTVNFVLDGDWLLFHGAPSGEKVRCIGREVVLQADEQVTTIPSYFLDPERACPATTFYRSVQVQGRLERIEDPGHKSRMLARLMERYQPEGRYAPLSASAPLYANAIRGVLVLGVRLQNVTGKAKLGQGRKPEELTSILEQLWARGEAGDPRAIELIASANPALPRPPFLRGPAGSNLVCFLDEGDVESATDLLEHTYWNEGTPRDAIARAQLGSSIWVGARDFSGSLIGTARANSDTSRHAFIADVAVAAAWQRRGLGKALVRLLLDHPKLRRVQYIRLGTADAQSFYEPFGFTDEQQVSFPFPTTRMLLKR